MHHLPWGRMVAQLGRSMPDFLDQIGMSLAQERPFVPGSVSYTVLAKARNPGGIVFLWFRTRGCRFGNWGGCTMCDYWIAPEVTVNEMVSSVECALESLTFEPDMVVLMTSGGVTDDWEVPPPARRQIYRLLAKLRRAVVVVETHAFAVTDETVKECTQILGSDRVMFEVGLESADPAILQYSINKKAGTAEVRRAIQVARRLDCDTIVNVLVGAPFLTLREMVEDSTATVLWSLSQGAAKCVLFPLNVKAWTLVHWMEREGLLAQPSLWNYVEVLLRLPDEVLGSVELAWFKENPNKNPAYSFNFRPARTCALCYTRVIELLDLFFSARSSRAAILSDLRELSCPCRADWRRQYDAPELMPFRARLRTLYPILGRRILGLAWWEQNRHRVLSWVSDSADLQPAVSTMRTGQ
ncbi:MAG: radical SAM protein [Lentisphaerae bacterium]|nr:radical SAM protein [Lentisphaerota bacterium]MBT7055417.1 radical SAM protein [Lentisphaerota bacterium]